MRQALSPFLAEGKPNCEQFGNRVNRPIEFALRKQGCQWIYFSGFKAQNRAIINYNLLFEYRINGYQCVACKSVVHIDKCFAFIRLLLNLANQFAAGTRGSGHGRGANITFSHEATSAPVNCALRRNHTELAAHLMDRGGKPTPHQDVQCNNLARARQKLNSGADVNHEEDPHVVNSPLETAIWEDLTEMVELLLQFGADPNQQDESRFSEHGMRGGDTPLHHAVYRGSAKMVKVILAHGADPDITNAGGVNAIDTAERKNHTHLGRLMEAHIDKKLSLEATKSDIEPLYTVQKVAELLSVDDTFVMELIKARKITGLRLDEKTLRITAGSVQRYLAKLAKLAT